MKYSQQVLHNKHQHGGAGNKVWTYFSMHDPENKKKGFTSRVRSCIPYSELQSLTHASCTVYM